MKRNPTLKTVKKVLSENKLMTLGLLFVIVAVVLLSLIPPQIVKLIIDRNLVPLKTEGLMALALLYLGVVILVGVFDFFKGGLLTVFGQKIVKKLRIELTYKLERISTTYFSSHTSGEITSRFTNDVENVNSLFADGIISMVIDCFKIVGIVISIWLFSVKLGLVMLCIVPVIYIITRTFQKKMLATQVDNLRQLSRVNAHISESLKNVSMIKSFSKEQFMEELYKGRLEDNFHTVEKVNFYDSCYAPIIKVTQAAVISAIVLLSSSQLNFLGISLGMVAASIELISNLFSPVETLGMEFQNIQKGISGVRRLDDFALEEEEPEKSSEPAGLSDRGLIFKHVSFSYDGDTRVLEDLNLTIKSGSSVTFAGRTGVGKTTLFRLIMGLLEPTEGRILMDGADVYDIKNSCKRRIFGYVEQRFSFISGTVAEQISLGDPAIPFEDIKKAMSFVGLHDTVMAMEKGYDTVIDGSGDFSQGQQQLLAIARAIVSNPAILLLDEVTANLDSVTEANIVTVLQRAKSGRTVLSVSHRLTSLLESDEVILLEDGRISAQCSPGELLGGDNWFAKQLKLQQSAWQSN